jgi:succinoglycan biosynthesis protein ExoM
MQPSRPTVQIPARVAVCIATFRRRELLGQLLAGLSELTFHKMPAPDIIIVVVDNDSLRTAEDTCRTAVLPCQIKYVEEPRRGIAQARNRAVLEAGMADFIAFIDDDEVPSPIWLDELLWAQASFGVDVVSGPVLPEFAADVPDWVKAGRFFDRPLHVSGRFLDTCNAGNVLVRSEIFATVGAFDERFALTGGEDTQFFQRVHQAGYTIVSSSEGIVRESVSRSRGNLGWLLRRGYQAGNSWALCEASLDRKVSTRTIRIFKACGWMLRGVLSVGISAFMGKAAVARSLQNFLIGAGMLAGLAGRNYQAYGSAATDSIVKALHSLTERKVSGD